MGWHALAAVMAILVGGCGRWGFEGQTDPSDGRSGDAVLGTDTGTDTTTPDGPAVCLFDICDGFETTTLDPRWTVAGTATPEVTQAHRGTRSIHVHVNALAVGQPGYSTISERQTFVTTQPNVWVRAYVRFAALPAATNGMELIVAEQTQSPDHGDYVFLHSNDIELYDQFNGLTLNNSTAAPSNTWICLVWNVVLTTANTGSLALTGDEPSITMPNMATDSSPAVGQLVFGVGFASANVAVAQPAFDMWIDDVIVHHTAVTCAD